MSFFFNWIFYFRSRKFNLNPLGVINKIKRSFRDLTNKIKNKRTS
jgi:hypothetical protein